MADEKGYETKELLITLREALDKMFKLSNVVLTCLHGIQERTNDPSMLLERVDLLEHKVAALEKDCGIRTTIAYKKE